MKNQKLINKEDVLQGFKNGVVHIINNPNDGEVAAQIGEHWFYFAGSEDVELGADVYVSQVGLDNVAEMVANAVNGLMGDTTDNSTEWLYYRAVLNEMQNK